MSTVIVAEKPSVARDIARVVGAGEKRDGYLETRDGNRIVTWAFGHLVRYADPDDYGAAWSGKWGFGQLPMIPDKWELRVGKEARKQFAVVKQLINAAELVICATDAGREGEHIFRLIYEHAGCKTRVQRLWVSSLTHEALSAGLKNLFPAQTFDPLAQAARVRAQADWLVGMNLTRAYTVQHGTLCSVGRVQTPTLALVVNRDRAIETFTKSAYYEVVAHLEGFDATYARASDPDDKGKVQWQNRIERREDADAILKLALDTDRGSVWNRAAVVDQVDTRTVRHRPPALYDLTTLQREANQRLGWTAAQTLEAAQALYEAKAITYPRTESRHLPEDMRPHLGDLLAALPHPNAELALDHLKRGRGAVPGKGYIDNAKLTDHHAIIPTKEPLPASLSGKLGGLYALVVSRFVSMFFPDQVVEETTVRLDISGDAFLANGRRQVEAGWRVVEPARRDDGDEGDNRNLPPLSRGQHVAVSSVEVVEKETSPPKRHTDASLLAAMKNAGRELDDTAQAEALKESGGLGTPATRASMIEGLLRRGYLARRKKALVSTDKGRALIAAVVDPLRSPDLTATWERQLKEIEDGNGSAAGFLDAIACFVRELVPRVRESSARVPGEDRGGKPVGTCPLCGKDVVERSKAFGCSAWRDTGCGFAVWKVIAGKKLTAAQVKTLLAKGRTAVIKGFKSKVGKPFEAALELDDEGKVGFVFEHRGGVENLSGQKSDGDKATGNTVTGYLNAAANGSRTDFLERAGVAISTALVGCVVGLRHLGVEESEAALRALAVARGNERVCLEMEGRKHVNQPVAAGPD